MALRRKRWQIAPPASPALLERFSSLHPLVVQMLYNRGITEPEAVRGLLEGILECDNPFRLPGVERAVWLIRQAITRGELLAVYGDYDADGVTATALLVQTLQSLGGQVRPYIPSRAAEGYGLNAPAITALAKEGVRLLLTVDCGIRSLEEVTLARRLGMQVVITDHHHLGAALPNAEAVINPRRPDSSYPAHDLAGVGVAFKLAQALLRVNRQVSLLTTQTELAEESLLDLVALGTVADMVPLLGENHILVQRGLDVINDAQRPGLAALLQLSGVEPGTVGTSTIGYRLAPRLNAAGRMGDARTALTLLLAPDLSAALPLAHELESLNRERRELTRQVQEQARGLALAAGDDVPLLFAASPDFPAGIVGLAAGRLSEEFYRPAIVVGVDGEFAKGSARSIPEFHITKALDDAADLLVRHGGHAAAAGFTVRAENLDRLRERLLALAQEQLTGIVLEPTLHVDIETPLGALSWEVYEALEKLSPFGCGNQVPVFASRRVRVLDARAVGAEGRHLKLCVAAEDGRRWDAIAFRQGEWLGHLSSHVDLAYNLERNEWKGHTSLQLKVLDICPAGAMIEREDV